MKLRLDQYLCQNGLVASRERAKALIMAGVVFVDEQKVDKPGTPVREGARVEVRGHSGCSKWKRMPSKVMFRAWRI